MSSTFTDWRTPRGLFDPLDKLVGGFAVDAAGDKDTSLCERWYGPGSDLGEDALAIEEWLSPAWCNPPYGKGLEQWLDKFHEQSLRDVVVVALLPAYTDRRWWFEKVVKSGADIIFLVGRVPFERECPECYGVGPVTCGTCQGSKLDPKPSRPNHGSALVLYSPTQQGSVGWVDWRKQYKVEETKSV